MKELNKHHVGVTIAVLSGIGHTLWTLVVWLGLAGMLINWWHAGHLFDHPYTILQPSN